MSLYFTILIVRYTRKLPPFLFFSQNWASNQNSTGVFAQSTRLLNSVWKNSLNGCFLSAVLLTVHIGKYSGLTVICFSDAQFVDCHSADLIQRVSAVMPIADGLIKIIHPETYSQIRAAATNMEKMRELLTALNSDKAKSAFYKLLKRNDPFLVKDLEQEGERD